MRITIDIEADFGSKFREEYAPQSLELMIVSWLMMERSFNKKTKIMCEYDDSKSIKRLL